MDESLPDYYKGMDVQPYGYRIMNKIEFDKNGKPIANKGAKKNQMNDSINASSGIFCCGKGSVKD